MREVIFDFKGHWSKRNDKSLILIHLGMAGGDTYAELLIVLRYKVKYLILILILIKQHYS